MKSFQDPERIASKPCAVSLGEVKVVEGKYVENEVNSVRIFKYLLDA